MSHHAMANRDNVDKWRARGNLVAYCPPSKRLATARLLELGGAFRHIQYEAGWLPGDSFTIKYTKGDPDE